MKNILIVDDSQVIRSLLEEYLTELGYSVEVAVNGAEGIEKALAGDFQVVFCDIHMPRKNGYEVFKEVRRQKPGTIFIMTDSLPDFLAEKAHEEGAYTVLLKPFDLMLVKKTLDAVFSGIKVYD